MNADLPRFLPERLRPPTTGRKRRRGFALLTVVPVMLLALPRWQVRLDSLAARARRPARHGT